MSELEVRRAVSAMAKENRVFSTVLRGAGAYDHYIPSIVKYIPAKEEFLTAYTPYQAEMSQGILQSIFEYQTMICELTGMDVSNASVYDGATAAAEAAAMCRDRKRTVTLVSAAAHPDTINTIRTYCYGAGCEMRLVPLREGKTDLAALKDMLAADVASFYVQQPNFYGLFEDAQALGQAVHEAGAMYVMGCNPIALAIAKTPAACGADVAVGEGQPLGMPLSYGGPYLGYMATTKKHMRKLPGRIVGETVDNRGERAFVLTLQAREQHIRREKASSNICSNQALCALTAGAYMAAMGPRAWRRPPGRAWPRPIIWRQPCARSQGYPCGIRARSSMNSCWICPRRTPCLPPWRKRISWAACRWTGACCGAPRKPWKRPSWIKPWPLQRRCAGNEADL